MDTVVRNGITYDYFSGTQGNDTHTSASRKAIKIGLGGNDSLSGAGKHNDILYGGAEEYNSLNSGNDTIRGDSGNDSIYGGDGNDYLYGDADNDTLYGEDGHDALLGGSGNDSIYGGDGYDFLDGGSGIDTLYGGYGDDYYYVDNPNDVVIEYFAEGNDVIGSFSTSYTLPDNVESLSLFSGAISGTGNALNNVIYAYGDNNTLYGLGGNDFIEASEGNDFIDGGTGDDTLYGGGMIFPNSNTGDDTLDGGAGNDLMVGQDGNDTYVVNSSGDVVVEDFNTGSYDTVQSSISYTLGANVENLNLTGTAAINGTGNNLSNSIVGNGASNVLNGGSGYDALYGGAGNDTLNGDDDSDYLYGDVGTNTLIGGAGNDVLDGWYSLFGGVGSDNNTMKGGIGNDYYYVDNASADKVIEELNAGKDTVVSAVNYTLGANVEDLILSQVDGLKGIGNALNNKITTESSNVTLKGENGNDTLIGNDFWSSNDILVGGLGNDILTGGGGSVDSDKFVFDTGATFNNSTIGVDKITDFMSGTDKIVLDKTTFTALSNLSFASVGTLAQAQTSSARITYIQSSGSLFYNQNGANSGLGTGGQFADLTDGLFLSASDFLVQA